MRSAAAILALASSVAFGQQLAFTTRSPLDSPVGISSFNESSVYGFESVVIENSGDRPVAAVQLRVTLHSDRGDETVDERRFAIELQPHDSKRIVADLAQVTGLTQKLKSARQERALVVLSVKIVEFEGGAIWEQTGPVETDPFPPPPKPRRN